MEDKTYFPEEVVAKVEEAYALYGRSYELPEHDVFLRLAREGEEAFDKKGLDAEYYWLSEMLEAYEFHVQRDSPPTREQAERLVEEETWKDSLKDGPMLVMLALMPTPNGPQLKLREYLSLPALLFIGVPRIFMSKEKKLKQYLDLPAYHETGNGKAIFSELRRKVIDFLEDIGCYKEGEYDWEEYLQKELQKGAGK